MARRLAGVGLLVGLGSLAAGCANADLPEARVSRATTGGPWVTQANAACTEIAASAGKRPTGNADTATGGVDVLTWHQNLAYMLSSRLQALPDAPSMGQDFLTGLRAVGTATEDLVTQLQAKPVDDARRQTTDAARSAAIGKTASLSAQLGLTACTPLVAGG